MGVTLIRYLRVYLWIDFDCYEFVIGLTDVSLLYNTPYHLTMGLCQ